jgi:hypothetical protein
MRRVGATFEALLLEEMLKPMARGSDAFDGCGLAAMAQSIAERDSHGFGALLAAQLDDRER